MDKNIYKNILLTAVVLTAFAFLLSGTLILHRRLNDWKINFTVSENKSGDVELTASVRMDGDVWRYFRGMPQIEIHGVDFALFFADGGNVVFELKSSCGTETIDIKENDIRALAVDLCRKQPVAHNGKVYKILPTVTAYKRIGDRTFVDPEKSKVINYQPGVNEITILLKHFSGNRNNITAELIFHAQDHRLMLVLLTLGTIFSGGLLLLLTISFFVKILRRST